MNTTEQSNQSEQEKLYDEQIAPKLFELATKCKELGMSFVGVVEYEKDDRGKTAFLKEDCGLAMVMINHCAETGTSIDAYVLDMIKYFKANNIDTNGSIVLNFLKRENKI